MRGWGGRQNEENQENSTGRSKPRLRRPLTSVRRSSINQCVYRDWVPTYYILFYKVPPAPPSMRVSVASNRWSRSTRRCSLCQRYLRPNSGCRGRDPEHRYSSVGQKNTLNPTRIGGTSPFLALETNPSDEISPLFQILSCSTRYPIIDQTSASQRKLSQIFGLMGKLPPPPPPSSHQISKIDF